MTLETITKNETQETPAKIDANTALLKVIVHYPPAEKPFKDDRTNRAENVGHLKKRVLLFFGLSEGATPDGGSVAYTLYNHKTPLDNPAQTLGDVAGDKKVMELKLSQQIVQG